MRGKSAAGGGSAWLGALLATGAAYYVTYTPVVTAQRLLHARHLSYTFFVYTFVAAVGVGAVGAVVVRVLPRAVRDRAVPVSLVVCGVAGLLLPEAPAVGFAVLFGLVGMASGAIVAVTLTMAAQSGSAARLGGLLAGPLLGSIAATFVPKLGANSWQSQIRVSGILALVIAVAWLVGRWAPSNDPDAPAGSGRSGLRLSIAATGMGLATFGLYGLIALVDIYLVDAVGMTAGRAESISAGVWVFTIVVMAGAGWMSDGAGVGKPFVLLGLAATMAGTGLLASRGTVTDSGTLGFCLILGLIGLGAGLMLGPWLAAYVQWGAGPVVAIWVAAQRLVLCLGLAIVPQVVTSEATLVGKGSKIVIDVRQYDEDVRTVLALDPSTIVDVLTHPSISAYARAVSEVQAGLHVNAAEAAERLLALRKIKASDLAYVIRNVPKVIDAAEDVPRQWRELWWICFVAEGLMWPTVFLVPGGRRPAGRQSWSRRLRLRASVSAPGRM